MCPSPTVQRCHSTKVLKCHCAPVHTTVLHRPTTMPGYHSGVPQCHSATTMPGCHSTTVPQCYDVATEATPKPAQRGEERTNHQLECGKSGRNQTMIFSLEFILHEIRHVFIFHVFLFLQKNLKTYEKCQLFASPVRQTVEKRGSSAFYLLLRRLSLGRLMYKTQGTVEKSRYTMKKSTVEKSTLEKNTSKVEKSMSTMEKRAHLLLSSAATALVWPL